MALFIALASGAWAVQKAAKNSVVSKSIKNGAVRGVDVRDAGLTGADVGDGSLTGADVGDGALTGADVGDGSLTGADVGDGSLSGADVGDDSLTGADIAEASLALPDRPPSGPAGGDLAGTYPNPSIAPGAVGPAEQATVPAVQVVRGTNQEISHNLFVLISFQSELFDTADMFDPASPNRLVAPIDGLYAVSATVCWEQAAAGIREIRIQVPPMGVDVAANHEDAQANTGGGPELLHCQNASGIAERDAGQFIQLEVVQTSGTPLDVVGNGQYSPSLSAAWIGPSG